MPMLAKSIKGIDEIMERFDKVQFTCEFKYDGLRGQIHYDRSNEKNPIEIYSRNLERSTNQFPELKEVIKQSVTPGVENFIIDSELVPYDVVNDRYLPF